MFNFVKNSHFQMNKWDIKGSILVPYIYIYIYEVLLEDTFYEGVF